MSGVPTRSGRRADTPFRDAIRLALARRETKKDAGAALLRLANQIIDKAEAGDMQALVEIANRLDGKPHQQIIHSGDADNPLQVVNIAADTLAEKLARLAERQRDEAASADTQH